MQGGVIAVKKAGYSLASPITWVAFPQLLDADIPSVTADKVDTTVHSVTSRKKRNIQGLQSVSDVKIKLLSDPNPITGVAQAAMEALQTSGATVWFRVELNATRANDSWMGRMWQGYVSNVEYSGAIGGRQECTITVVFDGEDVYKDAAAGASLIS